MTQSSNPLPPEQLEPEDLLPEEGGDRQDAFLTPEEYTAAKHAETGHSADTFFAPNAYIFGSKPDDHPEDDDHSTSPLMPGGFV
ncbi:MAG TPA: hypothetical protein VER79_05335 [Candidatus Limnocylindrales bacterium]|jgi:hypothetical protein|nr:hypothetical protein [Candidatus Limnocylindrales bacterium]